MTGTIETILSLLHQQARYPEYPDLLRGVRLWIDRELARVYAEEPRNGFQGQSVNVEKRS